MLRIQSSIKDNNYHHSPTVPLKCVNIEATIRSFAADVNITQVFRNDESTPIEAVYCFPIEEQAAIYSFVARINDREIVAQLKEKQEAQREYVNALQQGHGAVMLEQDEQSQDQFILNIGALLPSEECRITIAYVTELDLIHGSLIRFVIPTTIAPRYNPKNGGISSPVNTNSLYVQSSPYTIELRCHIEKIGDSDQQQIVRVNSTSHPIEVDLTQPDAYIVTFAQQNTHLDRDILINIELAKKRDNTILAVEQGAVMVAFTPTEEDCQWRVSNNDQTNEFIFVIDCSGSMNDENKIGLAKQAMLLFLRSLPINCHFNIIRFGSKYESLFRRVVTDVYNEKHVREAEQFINQMQANLGGTELLEPLIWLKAHLPDHDRARQIFLLTDGEIANVSQVLDLCQSMNSSSRIFSFGLGHSPSRSLVKGLARSTNGRFVFIPPNTNVDIPVGEQLQKALQSCITNIQIKWNLGIDIQTAPKQIPPAYINDRLIVYGLTNDSVIPFNHNSSVELETESDHHQLAMAKINRVPSVSKNETIARLAAKALILELQHEKNQSRVGSMQARFENMSNSTEDSSIATKKRIIELSLKYNILSPYTAFIGVEKRIDGNNEDMALREVPIQISADDQHLKMINSSQTCYQAASYSPALFRNQYNSLSSSSVIRLNSSASSMDYKSSASGCCGAPSMSSNRTSSSLKNETPTYTSTNRTKSKTEEEWPHNDEDIVRRLIIKQQYDGLWNLSIKNMEQLTQKPLVAFQSINTQIDNQTLITAIIIVVLETRFTTFQSLWHGVVQKARKRLRDLLVNASITLDELLEDIRKQL